ncbi:hypothetical protein AB0J86_01010 [Micromonospora sp. NPDC049559]|uniref:hypothetical protein n=1 Tax=Micromonospora sp. NPDC049559 TaxID=3155923 RepID=UPI00342A6DAE
MLSRRDGRPTYRRRPRSAATVRAPERRPPTLPIAAAAARRAVATAARRANAPTGHDAADAAPAVRRGAVLVAVLSLVLAVAAPVTAARRAAPGADCPPGQSNCDVWDSRPGNPSRPGRPGDGDDGGGGGERVCRRDGAPVPCYDDLLGWFNSADGCYYKLQEPQPEGTPEGKQWYLRSCSGTQDSRLLDAAPGGFVPPDPEELAMRALASIELARPAVHLAPNKGPGLVGLPIWMWTDPLPAPTASASAPGLTVTIQARARKVVWDMGDGTEIECAGAGTRYDPARHGGTASPDCGYAGGYPRSSRSQPGGVYRVTATTTWEVTWTGGGRSGTLPPQTRTSAAPGTIRVDELQVVTE